MPGCDGAGAAERSYPTSEARGSGREELPHTRGQGRRPRTAAVVQEGPRGATPHLRLGRRPRGTTPRQRSGAAAERSNPTSKVRQLRGCRRAERSYSMFKVRRGGGEEIPLIQGKEQWLRFAGAAVKRYPTTKVRETQVRG